MARAHQRCARAARVRPRAIILAAGLLVMSTTAVSAQTWPHQAGEGNARGAERKQNRISQVHRAPLGAAVLRAGTLVDVIQEVEPNNSPGTAHLVSIGDQAAGVVGQANDEDFFAVNLTAGTVLDVEVVVVRAGSPPFLDPWLDLYAPDGTTILFSNDDYSGLDSRIIHTAAVTGRYYFAISDYGFRGDPTFSYTIHVRTIAPGPGDPSSLLASQLPGAWAAAAGPGAVYLLSATNVMRVPLTGTPTVFAATLRNPVDLAVDGFGNVLVAEAALTGQGSLITRIQPDGTRSNFFPSARPTITGLAVASDGDVWVADSTGTLHRFDPYGTLRSSTPVTGLPTQLMDMAFSPAGVLHVSDYNNRVLRIENGVAQTVITFPGTGGLAFDRDGYLYVGTFQNGVLLFDPSYQPVHNPFAIQHITLAGNVLFARSATGVITSRLLAILLEEGTIREVNQAGVRAPGFRVGADLLVLTPLALRAGVVGAAYADTLRLESAPGAVAWSVTSGALPPGVSLGASTGALSGVPQVHGSHAVTFRAESGGRIGQRSYTIEVTRPVVDAGLAANQLLGQDLLSPELRAFLDLQGNRNGRFDIGDLRAYLRANPGAAATGKRN